MEVLRRLDQIEARTLGTPIGQPPSAFPSPTGIIHALYLALQNAGVRVPIEAALSLDVRAAGPGVRDNYRSFSWTQDVVREQVLEWAERIAEWLRKTDSDA